MALDGESVFVVTGAAGSIVAAIVADLAAHSSGTFHLLDLTPAPDRDDADLERLVNDRDGLKREIFERAKKLGEPMDKSAAPLYLTEIEGICKAYSKVAERWQPEVSTARALFRL